MILKDSSQPLPHEFYNRIERALPTAATLHKTLTIQPGWMMWQEAQDHSKHY